MEGPLMLPIPRLRLSRTANASAAPVAGPSRDRLLQNFPSDLADSDVGDRNEDGLPTPMMNTRVPLADPNENPAARLRALLARTPASSKSTPVPQPPPSNYSENESDFEPPSAVADNGPSFARESLKDIFSRALRDPGNTPQKASNRPRRNSIDASEVEASPRVERERAKFKAKRRSLSDEEFEIPSKSSQHSNVSLKSSQATTFDILRERLTNSRSQLKDLDLDLSSDSMYQQSLPDEDSNDTATFLRDINPNTTDTPPAATSTPQQSLLMSMNSQYPLQSNLMEQDSEMQRAFEGFDSYEAASSSQGPVVFPPSTSTVEETIQQLSPHTTQRRSEPSFLSHKKSQSFEGPRRRGSQEIRTSSRTSSFGSAPGDTRHADDSDRLKEREREWNKPKTPARAHTPELSRQSLSRQSSLQRLPRSGSPMVNGSLSRRSSNASMRSLDDLSSRGSSFGSQAEYQERLAEAEKERNIEREREWNRPVPKASRPSSSLGLNSPNAIERSRTRSLIQMDSPGRQSPSRRLQRQHSLTDSSRAGSPAGSLSGSHHGNDEPEPEIIHERERNWNAPRPKWTQHSTRPISPLSQSPSARLRAESSKASGTTKGEFVHRDYWSPSPVGKPASRISGSIKLSTIPVRSPKKSRPSDPPEPQPPEPQPQETPPIPPPNTNLLHEDSTENDQLEAGDTSPDQTPTMKTIPPPVPEILEHSPKRSPARSPRHLADNNESRLRKALSPVETSAASKAALSQSADENLLQEPLPPGSPPRSQPAPDSFLVTPQSFRTTKLEFQTPSPPKNLPDLPGPPTSEDDSNDETPIRALRPDLTAIQTPRPPGGWAATPAPPQNPHPKPSSSSISDVSEEQPSRRFRRTPIRDLGANLTALKTPKPPGAWASTPAPPPMQSSTGTRPFSGNTDDESSYSGLATPVASLSQASSLPTQTPGAPGAWIATPVARKSILKVRFDTNGGAPATDSSRDPLEDVTNASIRTDTSFNAQGSSLGTLKHENGTVAPRPRTPEPSSPVSPARRKSSGIRVLDAFGMVVTKEETKPNALVNATPRNKSGIRVVDAMGREVDGGDEPSQELAEDLEGHSIALNHSEALVRVRQGLADLASGLEDMDSSSKEAWIDYHRLKELNDASKAARAARKQLGQALSSNDNNLMSKLGPLRASMKQSGSLISTTVDRRWNNSWFFWGLLIAHLFLVLIMYYVHVTRAKNLFLTTYYDPFYPDIHLYTTRPGTHRLSMHSSSGPSWFSIPDTFRREGFKASSRQLWDILSILVWDWQQIIWETLGDATAPSSSWPPT